TGGRGWLKGFRAPSKAFSLVGWNPGPASDRFRGGSLAQLRGRARELGILKRALMDAEQGAGSVIGIAALPGIGKSRLCYEFSEWSRERQIDVFEAQAHIFGKATPLLPILELMRALFGITPLMEAVTARRQIEEKLLALDESFADDLPFLLDFFGLPAPGSTSQNIAPKARRDRLLSIVQRIVKAEGTPTSVIVFEDLHWLDEPSLDFLE